MLIEHQPIEKNRRARLAVVRKKSLRPPAKVKVIKMTAPGSQAADKTNLHPPVNKFNTGYLKAKKHDPL